MVTIICFLDNIEKSFNEAYRVLKYDGFVVVAFVDNESELGNQYLAQKDKKNQNCPVKI
jgi:ubiquinone/menaquinone biosynthesis C-methylase UbiE